MSAPAIHGKRPVYSASTALASVGEALQRIKAEDRLTWSDLGAVLGKSEDQAAKYADGTATMDFITFGRAKREWCGRFTGQFDRLCEDSRPAHTPREAETSILKAALALSVALADGAMTPEEVRANRSTLENARDAITSVLASVGPREAA